MNMTIKYQIINDIRGMPTWKLFAKHGMVLYPSNNRIVHSPVKYIINMSLKRNVNNGIKIYQSK